MSSFNNTTIRVLIAGALVLGAGIYYQSFADHRLDEANKALTRVNAAQSKADTLKLRAEQYVALLARMADSNKDRQEPFSVVSEFSPREISQVGPLLDTLYQRDGHFFLQKFRMAWRDGNEKEGRLPRVALDLEGRKVLLFSDEAVNTSSVAFVER